MFLCSRVAYSFFFVSLVVLYPFVARSVILSLSFLMTSKKCKPLVSAHHKRELAVLRIYKVILMNEMNA